MLEMLKKATEMMDPKDQTEIKNCIRFIEDIVDTYNSNGHIALATVALERSIKTASNKDTINASTT
jgi:hypothetical protein